LDLHDRDLPDNLLRDNLGHFHDPLHGLNLCLDLGLLDDLLLLDELWLLHDLGADRLSELLLLPEAGCPIASDRLHHSLATIASCRKATCPIASDRPHHCLATKASCRTIGGGCRKGFAIESGHVSLFGFWQVGQEVIQQN